MNPWLQQALDLATGGPEATTAEAIARGALVGCSLFALLQLLTMMGTRWGNRNTLSKAFALSVLIHFCLALGGATIVGVGRSSFDSPGESPADSQPVRIREVVVEQERAERDKTIVASRTDPVPIWQQAAPPSKADFARNRGTPPPGEIEPVTIERSSQPAPEREVRHVVATEERPVAAPRLEREETPRRTPRAAPTRPADEVATDARPETPSKTSSSRRVLRAADPSFAPSRQPRRETTGSSATPPVEDSFVAPLIAGTEPVSPEPVPRAAAGSIRPSAAAPMRPAIEEPLPVTPRARPPFEYQPDNPFRVVSGVLRGTVTDADTRKPIAAATIRVDQANGKPLTTSTNAEGTFELRVAESPENFAISASHEGHLPESRNLRGADIGQRNIRLDFALRGADDGVIAVEAEPAVHHLGNDRFQGSVNSQFQRPTEGKSLAVDFKLTPAQIRAKPARAAVTLMVKGVQCPPEIRINGTLLTADLEKSPVDGSFAAASVPFAPSLLRTGTNQIKIQTVDCNGDLDDFELVNIQIRLIRKE